MRDFNGQKDWVYYLAKGWLWFVNISIIISITITILTLVALLFKTALAGNHHAILGLTILFSFVLIFISIFASKKIDSVENQKESKATPKPSRPRE